MPTAWKNSAISRRRRAPAALPAQRRVNLREDKAVGQSELEVEPAREGLSRLRELRGSPSDTHRPPDHPTLRR